jgi:hypothetical protein
MADPGHAVGGARQTGRDKRLDLRGQLRRDALVGIQREDPVGAIATVSSALSASTTMISSAQRTDSSAAARFADSFSVMMVAVTPGTGEV